MDGENSGKPYEIYEQMDDLGVFSIFLETPKLPWPGLLAWVQRVVVLMSIAVALTLRQPRG